MCPNCFHSYNWRKIWFKKTDLWICVQTRQTNHVCFNVKERDFTASDFMVNGPKKTPPFPGWMAWSRISRTKCSYLFHQKPHVFLKGDWRCWCSLLSKCWSPISKSHPRYHQYSHYFACFFSGDEEKSNTEKWWQTSLPWLLRKRWLDYLWSESKIKRFIIYNSL